MQLCLDGGEGRGQQLVGEGEVEVGYVVVPGKVADWPLQKIKHSHEVTLHKRIKGAIGQQIKSLPILPDIHDIEKRDKIVHSRIDPYSNNPSIPSPLFTCEILNADYVYFGYKKHLNGR